MDPYESPHPGRERKPTLRPPVSPRQEKELWDVSGWTGGVLRSPPGSYPGPSWSVRVGRRFR